VIQFSEIVTGEEEAVIALWHGCNLTRAWNNPQQDLNFAMKGATSTVLVGKIGDEIIASAMVGHDGHRGALYYVAVDPKHQKKRLGTALMKAAENWLKTQGVWKINVMIREDNLGAIGFYQSLGFEMNAVISMGKKIS
jgi:ribosomal protein S18 acetylase RimI-like enzyme